MVIQVVYFILRQVDGRKIRWAQSLLEPKTADIVSLYFLKIIFDRKNVCAQWGKNEGVEIVPKVVICLFSRWGIVVSISRAVGPTIGGRFLHGDIFFLQGLGGSIFQWQHI